MNISVSSPTFREDTVTWKLNQNKHSSELFTILTAPVSEFSDLQNFSKMSFAIIHTKIKKEQSAPAATEVSGHLIHDDGEILYINIIREYHYYHLAVTSSGPISKNTQKAFSASVESLQEIGP